MSTDPEARLFVCMGIPWSRELGRLMGRLKPGLNFQQIKWVAPDTLHLTLAFMGDTPVKQIPDLKRALAIAGAGISPFEICPRGLGLFPSRNRPKVLWAGMDHGPGLYLLQKQILKQIRPLCRVDGKRFLPHLTLGRIKGPVQRRDRFLKTIDQCNQWSDSPRTISHFTLMESRLRPQGPLYTPLKRFHLSR